ncbi:MAG TPA: HEPN domain-containing protein [Anaerolineae bacterium]|nr:HEPN domain-containing protein [Anaerolineae bacterium]
MNPRDDARYRLTLAEGYLDRAERFYAEASWHDCVRDAQAAVENAGKVIVACFTPLEKTHEPAEQVRVLLDEGVIPNQVCEMVVEALPALEALGWKEHIQATYGDEATFTPPWELFNEAQAESALTAARRAVVAAGEVYRIFF